MPLTLSSALLRFLKSTNKKTTRATSNCGSCGSVCSGVRCERGVCIQCTVSLFFFLVMPAKGKEKEGMVLLMSCRSFPLLPRFSRNSFFFFFFFVSHEARPFSSTIAYFLFVCLLPSVDGVNLRSLFLFVLSFRRSTSSNSAPFFLFPPSIDIVLSLARCACSLDRFARQLVSRLLWSFPLLLRSSSV